MINRLLRLVITLTVLMPYTANGNSEENNVVQSVANAGSEEPSSDHNVAGADSQEHNVAGVDSEEHDANHNVAGAGSEEHTVDINVAGVNSVENVIEHTVDGANAGEHVIDQKNKTFSLSEITVGVGDKIKFVNSDSYFHNVYSLSDTAQFDLGSYPKGESRTITLDKAGKIVAQCAIHPRMRLAITVEDK